MPAHADMASTRLTRFRDYVRDSVFTELGRAVVLLTQEHAAGGPDAGDFLLDVDELVQDAMRIIEQV